jgi:orotate phosphoribosyltransferase
MRNIVNALFFRDGMVLLVRRSPDRSAYPGLWSFPGGHQEQHETLPEALIREVQEEVGVTSKTYSFLISIVDPNAPETDPATYHMYAVTQWDGGEPALRGEEHTELGWFSPTAAIALPDLALDEYRPLVANKRCVAALSSSLMLGEEIVQEQVLELLSALKGHFLLESGHHGDLWLDLESLCLHPRRVQTVVAGLAEFLSKLAVDAVCGPLVEGAFVALMVASLLDVRFTYSERFARPAEHGLFPAGYRVPAPLREGLRGKRVAIINDVINAGSAMRGTFADLEDCEATVVAICALLVLGTAGPAFATTKCVPLRSVATLPNNLWTPSECPLCTSGVPLEDIAAFTVSLPTQGASG